MHNLSPIDNVSNLKEDDSLFSEEFPYMLWRKKYDGSGENIKLHYHETMEIIISKGLEGERIIKGEKYNLTGIKVFVITPGTLHYAKILPNHGESIILKISLESLSHIINIDIIMASIGCNLTQLAITSEFYTKLENIVLILENKEDSDIFEKICIFSSLFKVLSETCVTEKVINENAYNNKIRKVIDWTISNYQEKINLNDAASHIGLSKSYFCKFFKNATNSTYLNYVNHVKMEKASKMLLEGKNVTEVSYACGFDNISYFVQLFKKVYNITPAKYVKRLTE